MKHKLNRKTRVRRSRKDKGNALLTMFMILMLLGVGASTYVSAATQSYQTAYRESQEIQTTPLCEAGAQSLQLSLWTPFKENQNFTAMDAACTGASISNPLCTLSGTIPGCGNYSAGVISYTNVNSYTRSVIIRCVGWRDLNNNGQLDASEPC
ncbi:MAG TPA: hypothetical protein VKT78_03030, partial [Fimbriimonadaceae bacterium]|nr:hypothetical protein [Fimbriimonadaceae bacterium]